MHKLYRTPKEHLARPLWALNNPIDLKADIRPVRLVRKQKAPNYSENDLVHYGGFQDSSGLLIRSEYLTRQSEYQLLLNCWIIYPIGPA